MRKHLRLSGKKKFTKDERVFRKIRRENGGRMTKQELEYRIEGLELEIASLEDENHWLEIEDMEVKRLEKALKTSEKELNDFKEKYLPQNLRDEQLFEIFIENKDKFTVEEFEKLLK